MQNYINLELLPRKNNHIDWVNIDNLVVDFCYKDKIDKLTIVKHIDSDYVLISYKEKEYKLSKVAIVRCCLGRLFNFCVKDNYRYDKSDNIKDQKRNLTIIKRMRIQNKKGYLVHCNVCDNEYDVTEANLAFGNRGCPYCSNHRVIVGKTDVATTHPNIALYFKNKEDIYKYSAGSNKKVDLICINCHSEIGKKYICDICSQGVSCKFCGDGISYPNKFMANILKTINIDFDTEVKFDWCKFLKYNQDYLTYGLYDFVIENQKLIIEMDSGLGHGNNNHSKSNVCNDEYIYRDNQKNILAEENGYRIVRIKCDYYGDDNRFEICKTAILNSELANIFNLNVVDWEKIDMLCQKSTLIEACELFNSGLSSSQIAKKLKKSQSTIIDYLHKGNDLKLCDFIPHKNKLSRRKK